MAPRLLIGPVVVGVALVIAGCATKGFVREETQKSETKLGQQVGQIGSALGQEQTRVTGVIAQVTETRKVADEATRLAGEAGAAAGQAGSKAEEAEARAGQAVNRAEDAGALAGKALAKADATDSSLTRLLASRDKRVPADTQLVTFGFDKWQLDDGAQTALLDVVKQLHENPSFVVDLEGYTDSVGVQAYNLQLSQRRVEAVRRFLVERGVELHRIQSIGLGDIRPVADNKTKQGREQNRRVAIKLFALAE